MLTLGTIAFTTPLILLGLVALPIIYWLLRVTPPAPRHIRFPALRILAELTAREETPARTPWWLLALRLFLAGLILLALAGPVLNPAAGLPGGGPIVIAIDNGWAAAGDWPRRQALLDDLMDRAGREQRRVVLVPTAPPPGGEAPGPLQIGRAADARAVADALEAHPWPVDRAAAAERIVALAGRIDGPAQGIWLADGLADGGDRAFTEAMLRLGGLETVLPEPGRLPIVLTPPEIAGDRLIVAAHRATATGDRTMDLRVLSDDGRVLDRREAWFADGDRSVSVTLDLQTAQRNAAGRVIIADQSTAAAVALLDERWRRRPVGIARSGSGHPAQPLLSDVHYLEQALAPYAEIRADDLSALLPSGVAVLLMPDTGTLSAEDRDQLERWTAEGGILVRFAGPLLAANPDTLVPTPIRFGDRALTGALSWTEPMGLAPFTESSPFFGLSIPAEVQVSRQVLADPTIDLPEKTWAALADGTPLITADRRGEGWLVLVHTSARPEWSNLSLTGLFVQMLRRMVALSEGVPGAAEDVALQPIRTLDARGIPGPAPATALPISGGAIGETPVGPTHPPGYYGIDDQGQALNLGPTIPAPDPLADLPAGVSTRGYAGDAEVDLMPPLLAVALGLLLVDLLITLVLRGLLPALRPQRAVATIAAGLVLAAAPGLWPDRALAQDTSADDFALRASTDVWLAYVQTGDSTVDETSRAGLETLAQVLSRRTAVEAAGAIGVDPARDELAFFPLLYWPMTADHPPLSQTARSRINDYLRSGGTILFDTRDHAMSSPLGGGPGGQRLQVLLEGLEIPPLLPVPPDHVLTKAFYLMQDFPGRYAGGPLWVEAEETLIHDGVSSIIIGANDYAAGWAASPDGQPLYPVVPGGERQREMARRFGVNLVMYTLTGNYKADQVHVPAILERLGQ